jgi:hypothetical protein
MITDRQASVQAQTVQGRPRTSQASEESRTSALCPASRLQDNANNDRHSASVQQDRARGTRLGGRVGGNTIEKRSLDWRRVHG